LRRAGQVSAASHELWGRELAGLLSLAISERFGAAELPRHRQQQRLSASKAGIMDVPDSVAALRPSRAFIFVVTTLALLGAALLACWLPARKAARLSPLEALRTD
jgi:ABC-type lipoprotein release transport system permease subunit